MMSSNSPVAGLLLIFTITLLLVLSINDMTAARGAAEFSSITLPFNRVITFDAFLAAMVGSINSSVLGISVLGFSTAAAAAATAAGFGFGLYFGSRNEMA